jgi:RES domain-containing protein
MHVWRICKQQHVPDAFSGVGAASSGGRWNHKGARAVYTSSSLSLASLELFVNLDPDNLPDDLHFVEAAFPRAASVEEVLIAKLPRNWRDYPAPSQLQDLGSKWLREMRSLLLVVPSAVNPEERNVLVNPLHPEMSSLTLIGSKPFHFDPRMWK